MALDRRRSTRATVLDLIRESPATSRIDLVGKASVTPATITRVVRELMDDGLVEEVGLAASRGGTPRRLLRVRPTAHYAVGVQLDRGTCTAVLTDFAGSTVAEVTTAGAGDTTPRTALEAVARTVRGLTDGAGVERGRVLGVGLATHGPQDRDRGTITADQPTRDWRDFPVTATLSRLLAVPALLENDASAAGVGEQWAGGVPTSTFGLIYLASGIGGCVVVDGELYRGRSANAVEIGHVTLDAAGTPCVCGSRGCVETAAGPGPVVRRTMAAPGAARRLGLTGRPVDRLADFERVVRAGVAGDRDAAPVVAEVCAAFAVAALTLVNLFDLDTVVLAGPGFTTLGPLVREAVDATLARAGFARDLHPARAVLSSNGARAAAVGAAVSVLRSGRATHRSGTPVGT